MILKAVIHSRHKGSHHECNSENKKKTHFAHYFFASQLSLLCGDTTKETIFNELAAKWKYLISQKEKKRLMKQKIKGIRSHEIETQ